VEALTIIAHLKNHLSTATCSNPAQVLNKEEGSGRALERHWRSGGDSTPQADGAAGFDSLLNPSHDITSLGQEILARDASASAPEKRST
jgi:hypothetical protein